MIKKLNAKGVSVVECITLKPKKEHNFILCIEAKSSAPNPSGQGGKGRFQEFIQEISHKFIHSLSICYAVLHQVQIIDNDKYPIGANLKQALMEKPNIRFILIIKRHKLDWCGPLQDALNQQLQKLNTIWNTTAIVLNEEFARQKGIID